MNIYSLLIGFMMGVIATFCAIHFGLRSPPRIQPITLIKEWDLKKLGDNLLIASADFGLTDMEKGAKIVVKDLSSLPRDILTICEVRINRSTNTNFALGRDRALVFTSSLKKSSLALYIIDPMSVGNLGIEFSKLWSGGDVYSEELPLVEAASMKNPPMFVKTKGLVVEAHKLKGESKQILKIGEMGYSIVALTASSEEYIGRRVEITGRLNIDPETDERRIDVLNIADVV